MGKRSLVVVMIMLVFVGCKKTSSTQESSSEPPQTVASSPSAPTSAKPSLNLSESKNAQPVAAGPSVSTTGPKYDWKRYDIEDFALAPLQGRVFPVPRDVTQLRVEVTADSALLAGVMSKQQIAAKTGVVRAANFVALPCAFVGTTRGMRQCSIDTNTSEVFILRDVRETKPVSAPVENKVKVTLLGWVCMEHCPATTVPAK
jgi:hypothetical protein